MTLKFLSILKECNYSLKNDKGKWLEIGKERGLLEGKKVDDKHIKGLRDTLDIILNSDKISEETKLYLSSKTMSATKVNDKLNSIPGRRKMSYSSTVLKINTDEKNLVALLGVDWIRNLMYGDLSLDEVQEGIGQLISKYGTFDSSRNAFVFEIDTDKVGNPYTDESGNINSEDFFAVLDVIKIYLKDTVQVVKEKINADTDFVSYYNYLLSPKGMQDNTVRDDRARLLDMLSIKDKDLDSIELPTSSEELNDEVSENINEDEEADNEVSEDENINTNGIDDSIEIIDTIPEEHDNNTEQESEESSEEPSEDEVDSTDLDPDLEDYLNSEDDIDTSPIEIIDSDEDDISKYLEEDDSDEFSINIDNT